MQPAGAGAGAVSARQENAGGITSGPRRLGLTRGKTALRRVPHDARVRSGLPIVSERSVQQRDVPLRQCRIPADADRNAYGSFFELTERAGRIAPGARRDPAGGAARRRGGYVSAMRIGAFEPRQPLTKRWELGGVSLAGCVSQRSARRYATRPRQVPAQCGQPAATVRKTIRRRSNRRRHRFATVLEVTRLRT